MHIGDEDLFFFFGHGCECCASRAGRRYVWEFNEVPNGMFVRFALRCFYPFQPFFWPDFADGIDDFFCDGSVFRGAV